MHAHTHTHSIWCHFYQYIKVRKDVELAHIFPPYDTHMVLIYYFDHKKGIFFVYLVFHVRMSIKTKRKNLLFLCFSPIFFYYYFFFFVFLTLTENVSIQRYFKLCVCTDLIHICRQFYPFSTTLNSGINSRRLHWVWEFSCSSISVSM